MYEFPENVWAVYNIFNELMMWHLTVSQNDLIPRYAEKPRFESEVTINLKCS